MLCLIEKLLLLCRFFLFKHVVFVGRDYVTFIVVVCNFVLRYKTNSVKYSYLIRIYCKPLNVNC